MTMRGQHAFCFLAVLMTMLGMALPSAAVAFGVSPGAIQESRLVRGSTVTRTISLVQGNPAADVQVKVLVDSADMKEWMSFDPGLEFTIPAGVQQFPFRVTIAVPHDTPFGNYSAFLRIRTKPEPAQEGGTVSVAVGARVDVDITVGEDVIEEFSVKALTIEDIMEGEPLAASARIENTGNVPTGPDSASFELFDKFGGIRLAYGAVSGEAIERIPPFSEKTLALEFPVDLRLAPGDYRGHVQVFDEKGVVVREVKTGFTVREKTFLDTLSTTLPYVLGVVLVLIAAGMITRLWRKKRLSGSANRDSYRETAHASPHQ